ncbi:MAG: DUF11 domain-containing protein [Planctomycetia bacterium]|nr:DUF11 domain-containing protein [Planctomycetia bacterium]
MDNLSESAWLRWWRIAVVVAATLILCSCRAPGIVPALPEVGPGAAAAVSDGEQASASVGDEGSIASASDLSTMPADGNVALVGYTEAYDFDRSAIRAPTPLGTAMQPPVVAPPMFGPLPLPEQVIDPAWQPHGMRAPWPEDEYLVDGGDAQPRSNVLPDWTLRGLEQEDTIAHYDTLDGRTVVAPSNRVHVYAPRFSAVRSVTLPATASQSDAVEHHHFSRQLGENREAAAATASTQNLQARAQVGGKHASALRTREGDGVVSSALLPIQFQSKLLPYEDLQVIRTGIHQQWEKPMLAKGKNAAVTWSHDLAVVALVRGQRAAEVSGDQRAEAVYTFDTPPGRPKLRIVKVASTDAAAPGETIDFTLRFDNVGDQAVGNVTIADNLTTRLEFVEGSAQASVKADFSTEANEGGSLVLRWEIADPLEPGQGGVVRFQCRVR